VKRFVIAAISVYQCLVSPDHSPLLKALFPDGYCRFYPSCSEYSKRSIEKFGLVKGGFLAIRRILRCNPFSKGGVDPVLDKENGA
jgi:putative membrane protein insertion efficiency factor